jgi:hypothetical protein
MVRRWGAMLAVILAVAMVVPMAGAAQDKDTEQAKSPTWTFYKLDLVVREMDNGKLVNTRSYTMSQRVGDWGQLRSGSRIPLVFEVAKTQYVDIGLNLDSRVQERGDTVAFDWRMELSSIPPDAESKGIPVIRTLRSNGQSLLLAGKPTILTSADDLNSTHKFVFEVTATKVK